MGNSDKQGMRMLNGPGERRHKSLCRAKIGAHRRAVALLLTLIAVLVAGVVAYSYLGSQGTSLGIARNINEHAAARAVAEGGTDLAIDYIKSTSDWRSARTIGVWVHHQALSGGFCTIRCDDGVDSDGDGTIEAGEGDASLSDDVSDPFTLTVTGRVNGISHVTRTTLTPAVADVPMLIYGDKGDSRPQYRMWKGSSWSEEQYGTDIGGEPRWVATAGCPTRNEIAACILDNKEDISLQFRTPAGWSAVTELTSSAMQTTERAMDVAYEQLSGDLLVVYRSSGGNNPRYRTYNGTTLSSEASYALPATGELRWVRLVPKDQSSEVILLTLDSNRDVCAAVWNGISFGSSVLLEDDAQAYGDEGISGAYETVSGDTLVVWSASGLNTFQYRTRSGGSWSGESSGPALGSVSPRWLRLTADPSSNKILLGALNGNNDLYLAAWDGASWGSPLLVDASTSASDSRCFDIAFEKGGFRAVAVWGRAGRDNFYYRMWNGSSWSAEQAGSGLTDTVKFVQLRSGPSTGQIHAGILARDASGTLQALLWGGASFSDLGIMETKVAGSNTQEAFMVSASLASTSLSSEPYVIDWRN